MQMSLAVMLAGIAWIMAAWPVRSRSDQACTASPLLFRLSPTARAGCSLERAASCVRVPDGCPGSVCVFVLERRQADSCDDD